MELIENSMRQPDFRGYWELYKNQEQERSSVASELFGKTIITSQFKLGEVNQIRLRDRIEYIRAIAVSNCTFEQICLKTPDGCLLDGIIVSPSKRNSELWTINFNSGSEIYEDVIIEDYIQAKATEMSVLRVNYRGTGRSTGEMKTSHDLEVDGETIIRYLFSKNIDEENILFSGKSLGGVVAARVRALFPNGPLLVDRSMWGIEAKAPKLQSIFRSVNWDMKVDSELFEKIKGGKIIISHADDPVINYSRNSLDQRIQEQGYFNKKNEVAYNDGYALQYFRDSKIVRLVLENASGVDFEAHTDHWAFHSTAAVVIRVAIEDFMPTNSTE